MKSYLKEIINYYKLKKSEKKLKSIINKKIENFVQKGELKESGCWADSVIKKYFPLNDLSKLYYDFFYSVLNTDSDKFIPVPLYIMHIEPVLNDRSFSKVIGDKNYYDKYLVDVIKPITIFRKINGYFYDNNYKYLNVNEENLMKLLKNADRIIIKASLPTDSGSGNNINLFKRENMNYKNIETNDNLTLQFLFSLPDFIIQEVIIQHDFFKQFNPDSNNTFRILTYRSVKNDTVYILHRLLRVGKKGKFLDHDNQGGFVIGVNSEGYINNYATDWLGNKYIDTNGFPLPKGHKIPFLNEMENEARKIAGNFLYLRLLAIDFSVNEQGKPLLLEINTMGNGTSQYQMNNGPLFGDFTEEILAYCSNQAQQTQINK
jgi:hypothetical protein